MRLCNVTALSNWGFRGLTALVLAGLVACAPRLRPPEVSPDQVIQERQKQRELALRLNMERSERLFRIASTVRLKGRELCGEEVEPFVGVLWLDQEAFPDDSVVEAAHVFGLGPLVRVRYVLPGSPADVAGLKPGDEVLSVGEERLEAPLGWRKGGGRIQRLKRSLENYGERSPDLLIRRDGIDMDLTIEPTEACKTGIALVNGDSVNAFTDGSTISVTSGMMRFADDDDEIALLLGHELSHIVLGHVNKQLGNQLLGGFFGLLLDVGMTAVGLGTGGVWTRLGARSATLVYSQAYEKEADYLGLYFTARSGFDISKGPGFFRKMGTEHPAAIKNGFLSTHPSTPERAVAMEKTIAEIEEKVRMGKALAPERKEHRPKAADSNDDGWDITE